MAWESAGIATVNTLLARRARFHQPVLVAHLTPYDSAYREALARSAALVRLNGSGTADASVRAHGMIYGTLLRQSSMLAFSDAFWVMGVPFTLILPLMFPMRKPGPVRGPLMVE